MRKLNAMKTLLILALFFAGTLHCQAIVDFTQPLIGIDGKPLNSGDDKAPHAMTLSDVTVQALEMVRDADHQATGADKFKWDELARRVYNQKSVSLQIEDIALIKQKIGEAYGPAVVGPAWRILESALKPKEPKKDKQP